jgi:hypothetical protein
MQFRLDYFLQVTNETLTATIVIVAASMLLYNLSHNLNSRVARASSVLLACVTVVNAIDVLTTLNATFSSLEAWLRVQWVGIAFAPAAMFHLSDALLATTGLVSRGRRRRISNQLYLLSGALLILALFTDLLVHGLVLDPAPHMLAGPMFVVYVAYFLVATAVSVYNVLRARRRCLTTYTHRRMGYLLYSFTMPAVGIFPFSLFFIDSRSHTLLFWLVVNLGNLGIALMLFFMAYPLSFFGSSIPDRVAKAELLSFFLRGPLAGIAVLTVILYMPQASEVFGLPGEEFMPFAAVALVMFWQWMVSLVMPFLERYVVYQDERNQIGMVQSIGQRLLTQNDLNQLFEAVLAAICDLLQVPVGFIASVEGERVHIRQSVGGWNPGEDWDDGAVVLRRIKTESDEMELMSSWDGFWIVPLYSERLVDAHNGAGDVHRLLGVLGVQARSDDAALSPDEQHVFEILVLQAAQALDDQYLQMEVFAALEGLLPEVDEFQKMRGAARYGGFSSLAQAQVDAGDSVAPSAFVTNVRDALRDYWGGPRLTKSALLTLSVVRAELSGNDNNPTRALRSVLLSAVNRLRPDGERSMTRVEWTLYNILELRFIQGYKVRDVAKRLAMSEADLYRKQRAAIEELARVLVDMEQEVDTPEEP